MCSAVMPLAEIDCSATFSLNTLTIRFQSDSTRERISLAVNAAMVVLLYICCERRYCNGYAYGRVSERHRNLKA